MDGQITPSDFLPYSPLKRPDWRWRRASWLLTTRERLSRRIDDEWVARARRFQTAQHRQDQDGQPRRHLGCPDAVVTEAFRLWRKGATEQRDQLEAHLLTPESFGEVAAHCSVSAATVEAYHQLFFTVRPHFAAHDWILAQAIGGDPWHGFPEIGSLWKFTAYAAGRRALEVVIAISKDQPLPDWLRTSFSGEVAYQEPQFRLLAKLAITALMTKSLEELKPLLAIREHLHCIDYRTRGTRYEGSSSLETMETFLRAVLRRPCSGKGRATIEAPGERVREPVGIEPNQPQLSAILPPTAAT